MKKMKLLYISILTFFMSSLHATINDPQFVNCQNGENLWRLTCRIGNTADCILDTLRACCPCKFTITQDMLPLIITEPGKYCVVEDLVGVAGAFNNFNIIIDGANFPDPDACVVVDFKHHMLDCNSNTNGILVLGATADNTVVKNGTIKRPIVSGITINEADNVIVKDMHIIGNNKSGFGIFTSFGVENSVIEHCRIIDCEVGITLANPARDNLIRNCVVTNNTVGLNDLSNPTDNVYCNNTVYDNGTDYAGGAIESDLCKLISIHDHIVCSKLEDLDADLESTGDVLCSKLEDLDADVQTAQEILCSKTEALNDDLLSISDVLCSKVEDVDMDLESTGDVLCSKLDVLDDCLLGTIITQDDIPLIIDTAGKYTLCENVTFEENDAIIITASCVTLDLNGYSITGTDVNADKGIRVVSEGALRNIVIENGSIKDVGNCGIFFGNVVDSVIRNVAIGSSGGNGITLGDGSSGCLVEYCAISDSGSHGIELEDAVENSILRHCTVINSINDGFDVDSGISICLIHCKSFEAGNNGFLVQGGSKNVQLINCSALNPVDEGFKVQASTICVLDRCTAKCSTNGNGFEINQSNFVVIRSCIADTNNQVGFLFTSMSNENEIRDSSSVNNGTGIEDNGIVTVSCNNLVHGNTTNFDGSAFDTSVCSLFVSVCDKIAFVCSKVEALELLLQPE